MPLDPLTMTLISAGVGMLGGLVGAGNSPAEKQAEQNIKLIKKFIPQMQEMPFTEAELEGFISGLQSLYRGGANVAAGQIGAAVGESGVTEGQGFSEYYTQALAPIIARGEELAGNATFQGKQLYAQEYDNAKNRVANLLSMLVQGTQFLPDQTSAQRGFLNFLNTANLAATGFGNISEAYKNFNS